MPSIANLRFMPAAGWAKTTEQVSELAKVGVISDITVGSFTVEPKEGNSGNVFYTDEAHLFALNSLGLPNRGAEYLERELPEMLSMAQDAGKELRVSIAGSSLDEYKYLISVCLQKMIRCIEINLGCPNVWTGTDQKPIFSYSPELVGRVLEYAEIVPRDIEVDFKLSPFANPLELEQMAELIVDTPRIVGIVTSNTFPNALAYSEDGAQAITPGGGLAGYSGPGFKPIVLGQVAQFRKLLPATHPLIAVGGISCGRDMLDFWRAGATGFQIGAAFFNGENFRVFEQCVSELIEFVEKREVAEAAL